MRANQLVNAENVIPNFELVHKSMRKFKKFFKTINKKYCFKK